jgi:hypothetical protein
MKAHTKKRKNDSVNQRILALHQKMVDKILAHPALLEPVKNTLEMRYNAKLMRYGSYMLWSSILETIDTPELFRTLVLAEDARTANLRRDTIFTGILTEEERRGVLALIKE